MGIRGIKPEAKASREIDLPGDCLQYGVCIQFQVLMNDSRPTLNVFENPVAAAAGAQRRFRAMHRSSTCRLTTIFVVVYQCTSQPPNHVLLNLLAPARAGDSDDAGENRRW
jgi:hypothetical protein